VGAITTGDFVEAVKVLAVVLGTVLVFYLLESLRVLFGSRIRKYEESHKHVKEGVCE